LLGECEVRREVSRVEEMSNYLLRELGVGFSRPGNGVKTSSTLPAACSLRRAQCGVGGKHSCGWLQRYYTRDVV